MDPKCDVCNNSDYIAGVCCSSLGAVSFSYCTVCLAMGAEPKGILETMQKDGLFEFASNYCYFEKDSYFNLETKELIHIVLESGQELKTRQEVINVWNKKKEVNND